MAYSSYSRRSFLKLTGLGLLAAPVALSGCATLLHGQEAARDYLLYIGTNIRDDESVFLYRLHPTTGAFTRVGAYQAGPNPTYLTLTKDQRHLYAVNELTEYEGMPSGAISAFAVNQQTGDLTLLNQQASHGGSPCYISLDATNQLALVANYVGGNVSVLPVQASGWLAAASATDQHQGSGPHPNQKTPHAHCFLVDPANRFAFAVDLGTDTVYGYRFDSRRGTLQRLPAPAFTAQPGAGPRHLTFHPNGRQAYLINELNSTITALAYNQTAGNFQELQTVSALPADYTGANACADVHVSPNGRFLYGSNRGHNSLVVFRIADDGRLTLVQHASVQGNWPRNFTLTPSGHLLLVANQYSNNIVSFHVEEQTGRLLPTGNSISLPTPMFLRVLPDFTRH